MTLAALDNLVIRYGSIKGRELLEPKRLERNAQEFQRTGILLKSGPNLIDYVINVSAPHCNTGTELGKIHLLDNQVVYTPLHPEIGDILHRKQYDIDVIANLDDDEHPPHMVNPQILCLYFNEPFLLRRGDIIMSRFYHEGTKNLAGTYVEIYNIVRAGESCKE
jgi:hypothetical protein